MKFEEITLKDVNELANIYVNTFNSPPWNDEWSIETVLFTSRDDGTEGFYQRRGLKSYNSMVMMGKEL